ncbi:MAG: DUF72 domain-containing protein [Alphaproteobacteria bacterium]|nr:DUF72 domain-containing protein [Alphaproteobacteria bacterium]
MKNAGAIRVGIGGWVFPPWRGAFYPAGLPQAQELAHASRQLTAIEINGTFYGAQKPTSFRRWHADTPDGFVFSVKGPRYATHRRDLAEAGSSIERFFDSGVLELQDKLGPVLWQFPPTMRFDAGGFAAFLELLPQTLENRLIRHVVEVRHNSFRGPEFYELLRRYGVPAAIVEDESYPELEDIGGDFAYFRLRRCTEAEPTGYAPAALDGWAERLRPIAAEGRNCFVYFINGAKVRAPAAAQALLDRL